MKILLIEDNPLDAELFRRMFDNTRIAAQIEHITTMAQCEDCARREDHPVYDLIFLDLTLADSIGISTVQRTRTCFKSTPIVVITGDDRKETVLSVVKQGANDFILKRSMTEKRVLDSVYYIEKEKSRHTKFLRAMGKLESTVEQFGQRIEASHA